MHHIERKKELESGNHESLVDYTSKFVILLKAIH